MIREAGRRYGVAVIDTYDALKTKPIGEIYNEEDRNHHHSQTGNEVVADLIASESPPLAR
jgi:hypothetical protein